MLAVVDTVVAQYFLLADRFELLSQLLGRPVVLPRVVYDPDEAEDADDLAISEIARGLRFFRRRARTPEASDAEREAASRNAQRLAAVHRFVGDSLIETSDMTEQELPLFGRLTSGAVDEKLLPLGAGEAACVAIGVHRGYVIATDDSHALRVLQHLAPRHPYERIRKLLIRAAEEGRIGKRDANNLHAKMRSCGFWDTTAPFPD